MTIIKNTRDVLASEIFDVFTKNNCRNSEALSAVSDVELFILISGIKNKKLTKEEALLLEENIHEQIKKYLSEIDE